LPRARFVPNRRPHSHAVRPMSRSAVWPLMGSAFSAVFADLGLSDRDDAIALRAARRIIELAAAGERDPERLRAATIRWVTEWAKTKP
jgi:hypothetical protein